MQKLMKQKKCSSQPITQKDDCLENPNCCQPWSRKEKKKLQEWKTRYCSKNRDENLRKKYQVKYCVNTFNAAIQLVF